MKLELFKREGLHLLAGKVVACNEGAGVFNIKLTGNVWNKELQKEERKTVDIAFWNNAKAPLADRAIKAGLGVGAFVSVLCTEKNNRYTAINFKYNGLWKFQKTETSPETNVLIGTIAACDDDSAQRFFKVSVPVNTAVATEWHKVTFWNNETAMLGERAKKCLSPRANGTKPKAAIICGQNKPYNGHPSYSGYRFEIID